MRSTAACDIFQIRFASEISYFFSITSIPQDTSFQICPPFLPEAPQPNRYCSSTITFRPFFAASIAVDNPENPPPTIQISHS